MKQINLALVCIAILLLTSCGGGGAVPGDNNPPPDDDEDPVGRTPPYIIAVGDSGDPIGDRTGPRTAARISDDGRTVVFTSKAAVAPHRVFVFDVVTESVRRVIDIGGFHSELSGNGRFIAFESDWAKLPSDTNNRNDVYILDIETDVTTRVSLSPDGFQFTEDSFRPDISADGRRVLFGLGGDVVFNSLYIHDRESGATRLVIDNVNTLQGYDLSDNGSHVVFSRAGGLHVVDLETDSSTRVDVSSEGVAAPSYSSRNPVISANGRYVAFSSEARNLVPDATTGRTHIYVHDTESGETTAITDPSIDWSWSFHQEWWPNTSVDRLRIVISADGQHVAFSSPTANAVLGDTNNAEDVFIYSQATGELSRVSVTPGGVEGNGVSYWPDLSANGRDVVFTSESSNLADSDYNHTTQTNIFVKRLY